MSRARKAPFQDYFVAALIFVVGIVLLLLFVNNLSKPKNASDSSSRQFEIEKGESVRSIADRLEDEGLVRSSLGFRLAVRRQGVGNRIQAGVYQLKPSMSSEQIAETLTVGRLDKRLTIPEGYRLEEIAEIASRELGIDEQAFREAAKGYEGKLFPDTYFLSEGATAEDLVKLMRTTYDKKTAELKVSEDDLILASLVERETKGDAEKPVVAGILKKRLAAGWPLELDATIQYILGKKGAWWTQTTLLDRQTPSPYNSYLNKGLPPGPIGSPGLTSINAVVNAEASDYWFYLHDRQGVIRYAKTNDEHNQNIEKYIR